MPVSSLTPPSLIDPAPIRTAIVRDDKTNFLSNTYEKWFAQIYRAILANAGGIDGNTAVLDNLAGTSTTPVVTFAGIDYFYLPTFRVAVPQAALAALAATNPQKGLLVHVTDYNHMLEWNGAGWQWGPGESGSQYVIGLLGSPVDEPWFHPLDGTAAVKFLKFDGTLGVQDLPTTPDQYFRI